MSDPERFPLNIAFSGSPAATLAARVAAVIAGGTIPCACPHPVTADLLSLPSYTLRCGDCEEPGAERADGLQGRCAACGAPGARTWGTWVNEAPRITVTARLCQACTAGTSGPLSSN